MNLNPSVHLSIKKIEEKEVNVRKLRATGSSLNRGNNPTAFRKYLYPSGPTEPLLLCTSTFIYEIRSEYLSIQIINYFVKV